MALEELDELAAEGMLEDLRPGRPGEGRIARLREQSTSAVLRVAGSLDAAQALLAGRPVPASCLAAGWAERLGLQAGDEFTLDLDLVERIELLASVAPRGQAAEGNGDVDSAQPFVGLSHAEVLKLRFEGERHLVADLIEPGTVGVLAGVPETFKSRLAQAIAAAVALGEGTILGRTVETQGAVGVFWQDDSRRNEA